MDMIYRINRITKLPIRFLAVSTGFASKVRLFKISFTPGFSPVIGRWKKFAKPF